MQGNNTSNIIENIYKSIDDMPIYNWHKIQKDADLTYIFIDKKGEINEIIYQRWEVLQDEYIERFGLEDGFKHHLRMMKKATQLNCDYIATKNALLLNEIAIIEAELNSIEEVKSMDFYEVKDYLEKHKGFRLDPKQVTVTEYYYSLKNMRNGKAN